MSGEKTQKAKGLPVAPSVAFSAMPSEILTPANFHQTLTDALADIPSCTVLPDGVGPNAQPESPQKPALQRMTIIIPLRTPPSELEAHDGHPGCANFVNDTCSWGKGDANDDESIRLWDCRPVCHDCVEFHNYWTWKRSRYAPKGQPRKYVDWRILTIVPDAQRLP